MRRRKERKTSKVTTVSNSKYHRRAAEYAEEAQRVYLGNKKREGGREIRGV
jgi:hypothetical protein